MSKWEMVRLGNLFKITSGGTPAKSRAEYYENGTVQWVRTGDLKDKYIKQVDGLISEEALKGSSAKLFPAGTVLLAMYGATIGACSILAIEAATNQACAAFVPNPQVNNSYLYYFLHSQKQEFIKLSVGGAQPNISGAILKKIKIPLPPLEVQQKIAQTLDAAAALLAMRKEQLAALDNLIKAVFYEMFGDPVTNEKGWEVAALEEKCNIVTGNTPSRRIKENYGEYIEWIKSDNINTNKMYLTCATEYLSEVGYKSCRYVDEKSVLMTCIAGSINCIGNVAIADRKVSFNRVFCITSIFKKQRDIIRRKMLRQVLKNAIQLSAIKPGGTAAKKGQTTPVIA